MEPRLGNKFRLGRKIGSGSFGEIYLGALLFPLGLDCSPLLFSVACSGIPIEFVLVISGTNIVSNEEVAIKLVSYLFQLRFDPALAMHFRPLKMSSFGIE